MAVYEYMRGPEAFGKSQRPAIDRGIKGLRVAYADWVSRTASGNSRTPERTWEAQGYLAKFKILDRMERREGRDYNPGTYAVIFTDGTETYIDTTDLLCVEVEIQSVHYGESRSLCGVFEEFDKLSQHIPSVTCRACHTGVHATV